MKWMNKLERKLGKYAIPNLMFYVIILYIAGFVLDLLDPTFYSYYLALDAEAIMHGQVWRLVTFLIQPPPTYAIFMIIALYFYYTLGRQLEFTWGSFKFNLYFFMGVIFNIVATMVLFLVFHVKVLTGTYYLNAAIFLSYAAMYPNQQFYLFFFIPIKVKWLAWIEVAGFGYSIINAYAISPRLGLAVAVEIFVALLNFIIFYYATRKTRRFSPKEIRRKQIYRSEVQEGRKESKHRCHVCGRTELDDDTLEFRYCSKCNGDYEYCQDHLFTHEHIK